MIPHNDSTYMIPYTEYVPEAAMPSTLPWLNAHTVYTS
jgi:hypothetical protein